MITLAGCGDAFISKCLPQESYEGFSELSELIKQHDFCFCNLETTIHINEGYPSLYPGGGWSMASPEVLKSLTTFGFNALNLANNHAMDYCQKGLEATLSYLEKAHFAYTGAGHNLREAASPAYIDCPNGKVAFIGVTSSFHDSDAAGNEGLSVPGRPGVNPLRHKAIYELTPELYESVLKIGKSTGMNDTLNWSAANGYRIDSGNAKLRNIEFARGTQNRKISHPDTKDMERIISSIHEAKTKASCIVASIHSHQFKGADETPDDFIVEFCHTCIDEGAHIVFGHGSHILRGIEVYNQGIIFYGLGDFILQHEDMSVLPADFYEKYGISEAECADIKEAMLVRNSNRTKGLVSNLKAYQSILASIDFDEETRTLKQVRIFPLSLQWNLGVSLAGNTENLKDTNDSFGRNQDLEGWPVIAKPKISSFDPIEAATDNALNSKNENSSILKEMVRLSESYGTKITLNKNVGYIEIS